MNTVKVENCKTLFIGRRGENEVTEVVFDFSEWQEQFGAGVIDLYVKRNLDVDAYPVVLSVDGTVATWLVTAADTDVVGNGKIEFVYTVDQKVAKSAVFPFFVGEDIGESSPEPPEHYQSWLEQLTELGAETQANAQAAAQSANDAADSVASAEANALAASKSASEASDSAESADANARLAKQSAESADADANSAAQSASDASDSSASAESNARAASQSASDAADSSASAEANAQAAAQSESNAEAWAVGERGGRPVSAGDPTYENSAKYWAENARDAALVKSVNGKTGVVEIDLDDIPNGETYARATPAQLAQIGTNAEDIADIDEMIPNTTSESNPLVNVSFLTNRLTSYRTSAAQDTIDSGKQDKITAYGLLKRDRSGNISAAVAGADYVSAEAFNVMRPAATTEDIGKALIVKAVENGKPSAYEYGEAGGGGGSALTAGDGLEISNDVISNTQGIEYIVGTQTAATSKWTGVSTDETLKVGKIIAYYLPYAGTSTVATLALTMADGTTTREISLQYKPNSSVTTQFPAGSIIILVYDGTYWRVNASYDTDTNTYPTGYCVTNGSVAAKAAACSFGYRGDANYFPCLFRFANTAADATLAITTYAPEAAPIYVNGARTSATNTFSAGVILFLYYNGAYYCYNDGRFPILVDGAVTSVQEYAAGLSNSKQSIITALGILKGDGAGGVSSATAGTDYATPQQVNEKYAKPSGGIPSTDMTAAVQASLSKADTALQAVPDTYRTAADQDVIDNEQDDRLDAVEQATTATTIGPVALATFDASAADMPLKGLTVDIEPVQDLHGYDNPWPAGGGKNLLINERSNQSVNGLTITVNDDGTMLVNGTATETTFLALGVGSTYNDTFASGSYIVSGCPTGGSTSTYCIRIYKSGGKTFATDVGNGAKFTDAGTSRVAIVIFSGATLTNVLFKPMVRLASETDATFEPYSNICPITGWTGCNVTKAGKNLFNIPSGTLKVGTIDKDTGVIDTSASTSRYTENMLKIKGGANYAFQCVFSGSPQAALYMAYYDSNGAFLERVVLIRAVQAVAGAWSGVVQMRDDASYIRLCGYVGVFTYSSNRQIEEGNEITDYEPYQGNTYSITFPTEAGTVYGGTLDVTNGVLTVDRAFIQFDENTQIAFRSYGPASAGELYPYWATFTFACNCAYNYEKWLFSHGTVGSAATPIIFRAYKQSANVMSVVIGNDTNITNITDVKNFLQEQVANNTPLQVCYALATPIEIPLTPTQIDTLLGENNIWADCGDVTVTYGAYLETVKAYADKVGDSILSAIAPLETSYIATRGYAVGTYLFVGTKFYKVISAIAEGGTITPGTNVTQTTVAEQLMVLSFVILEQPHSKSAAVGETVSFSVIARGVADYKWFFRSIGDSDDSWGGTTVDGSKTSTIQMEATAQRYGFEYRCRLTGISGEVIYTDPVSIINPST